ncbi:hypothetical protein D7X96_02430 [Corallococcus interemptor]|uniref:RNA polymerase sigma-70 region 4 domain-containing protein n=1 Tax=Corallococcus interemptor TaxID=2316720 RepID=A0A3A8QWW6_9BACT|nr:hypothetical protein D7X96_02430 [Corallococcus interemptor]
MSEGHPTTEKLQRAIVRAFQEEGMTYGQIAHLLGIGMARVNRVLRRALPENRVRSARPSRGRNFPPFGEVRRAA